ncbi:MAG TPA: extracellular solute-binding protein [Ktedonobacteraceae bacterium]|nr:extracellular solute-binding protein [Ktedonobacteraceae bacterium]
MQFAGLTQPLWSRRAFLRGTGAAGLGLASCGFLTACEHLTGMDVSNVTATISGTPGDSDPAGQKEFLTQVGEFERLHPHRYIVGSTYTFDPTNYYIRLAAGEAEDSFSVYLTEPQFLIEQHAIADITDLIKGWQYFDSFVPSFLHIMTGPGNRIYGIPLGGYALGLLYNRRLFMQAGLNPDRPPTTWKEFREYARRLTGAGVVGFAEVSGANQGGWHFTSWMYSVGGDLQRQNGDKWVAVFNSEKGIEVLNLLMEMRFGDQSMSVQPLQNTADVLALMATGNIAMAVMAPDALATLRSQRGANLDDFGLGPMPQNGGNATLAGGGAWVFNPKSSPEVLQTAFDWIMFSNYDLHLLEERFKRSARIGRPIGSPTDAVCTGVFKQKLDALVAKYANMPIHNYLPFTMATPKLNLRTEPPIETQAMYSMIDHVMQTILTNAHANPQALLDEAAHQFQIQILDNVVYR